MTAGLPADQRLLLDGLPARPDGIRDSLLLALGRAYEPIGRRTAGRY